MKTYPKTKLIEKLGILMQKKCLFWVHLISLVANVLCRPKNMDKSSGFVLFKIIDDHGERLAKDPWHKQFICYAKDDQYGDIIWYNNIINQISNQDYEDMMWKLKRIVAHEGPLINYHTNYKGSHYNMMVEWEKWETNTKPLSIIA